MKTVKHFHLTFGRTYNKVSVAVLAAAVAVLLAVPAHAQKIRTEDEAARLRRENFRLRARIDSLQRVIATMRPSGGISSLDGSFDAPDDGFLSFVAAWDALEGVDEYDYDAGMVPLSRIDTLLRIPDDDVVRRYVSLYTVGRNRSMVGILHRYDKRLPEMRAAFSKYGVPEELTMLAIVESAMNANAVSHAGAAGMWQIMPSVARQYGLRVTPSADDRFDASKSTAVAAHILADAYRDLGDWGLAAMSYNCGVGRVQKALAKAGPNPTYEEIYRYLPRETREYLPALVAAMYVNANRIMLFPSIETYGR